MYIFFTKVESTNFEVTSTSFYVVIQEQLSLSFWNMWRKQLREQCLRLVKVHQLLDWQLMFRGIRSLKNGHLRLVHWCWLIKASVWLMSLIKYVHFFLSMCTLGKPGLSYWSIIDCLWRDSQSNSWPINNQYTALNIYQIASILTHMRFWENMGKVCQSQSHGGWFTKFSSVSLISHMVY